MAFEVDDEQPYIVLINDEGQYSIWPQKMSAPAGWNEVDFVGSRSECTAFIDQTWLDMRPISLRRKMDA